MILSKAEQIKNLRLIRRKEVQAKTGFGASSIYAEMAKGAFPKPIQISERRVAWIESEVDAWIAARIESRDANMSMAGV
ncbi:helix-turn-helix transcriptional regulator [Acinetobacter lwoffii]|uniref:helix-turn-helix transcriptional regulator n=1 Tax=Acinetobacter lwoffii TaxID=28090 RepID=UPI0002CDA134|nr:AlpA family transcriptional regulator [Acinetobacter lwoffii]ENW27204.1 hypothetical protein F924_02230 [Acinetobacter lwoffii ATCC 9957 = CIP 70.31]